MGDGTALAAAATAAAASSMPAPHVEAVQWHSSWSTFPGAWQAGTEGSVEATGKGRALARSTVRTSAGRSSGRTESTSAAVPATSGAAYTDSFDISVGTSFAAPPATGAVCPGLVVVSSG